MTGLVLVDTSVWIDYFAARETLAASALDKLKGESVILLGDLVLVETLQGIKDGPGLWKVEEIFAPLRHVTLCGSAIAPIAAANYRRLRRKGVTVRGTIDVIIATWCIENDVTLLHNNRDFGSIQHELGLRVWQAA